MAQDSRFEKSHTGGQRTAVHPDGHPSLPPAEPCAWSRRPAGSSVSTHGSACPSLCLFICPSPAFLLAACPSACLPVCLPVCLSMCTPLNTFSKWSTQRWLCTALLPGFALDVFDQTVTFRNCLEPLDLCGGYCLVLDTSVLQGREPGSSSFSLLPRPGVFSQRLRQLTPLYRTFPPRSAWVFQQMRKSRANLRVSRVLLAEALCDLLMEPKQPWDGWGARSPHFINRGPERGSRSRGERA